MCDQPLLSRAKFPEIFISSNARALQISMVRASGVSQVLIFMTSFCQEWAKARQKTGKFTTGALQINLSARDHTRVFTLFARVSLT
jgi:hypothetical protein